MKTVGNGLIEKHNEITKPSHYQFAHRCDEVRDVIRDRTDGAFQEWGPESVYDYTNAIKYILRAPYKNKLKDLRKAKYCIESILELLDPPSYD